MADLALGDAVPRERLAGAQTPGGTGAIRQLCELIRRANPGGDRLASPTRPGRTTRRSSPTSAIPARSYRYFDAATRGVDFAGDDGRPRRA